MIIAWKRKVSGIRAGFEPDFWKKGQERWWFPTIRTAHLGHCHLADGTTFEPFHPSPTP